jgi:hypothetical protein
VSPAAFYLSLLLAWIAIYLVAPTWLVMHEKILSGGLVQLVGAFLPGIWQGIFWPDEAGNFGLLMMLLVPIPLCIIACGILAALVRVTRQAIKFAQGRGL